MRKISGTNPLPPGTQNVPINMKRTLAESLGRLAKLSNMSRNRYCVHILNQAAEEGRVLKVEIRDLDPVLNEPANSISADVPANAGKPVSYLSKHPPKPSRSAAAVAPNDKAAVKVLGVAKSSVLKPHPPTEDPS